MTLNAASGFIYKIYNIKFQVIVRGEIRCFIKSCVGSCGNIIQLDFEG